ncbi:hypothetical protein KP509_1Z318200 [Ceratopteris richardii]|nr:hypothetical protein KP509_1Z318200 [Ceratopteris richardii]
MDSKPWQAGRFAHSLRTTLWAEHLGISQSEMNVLVDPVCEKTYKHIWMTTAKVSSSLFYSISH